MANNRLATYEIPAEIPKQEDFILKIRAKGEIEWQNVEVYRVIVDMHDPREASMVYFDFTGEVELEITFPNFYTVYDVQVRPNQFEHDMSLTEKNISLTISEPANFSVEINKDRFHNLHIFAGDLNEKTPSIEEAAMVNVCTNEANAEISELPPGRLIYIEPGIHWIASFIWTIPANTRVYLAPGAVLMGGLRIDHANNIELYGRGVVYQGHLPLPYYTNGLDIHYSQDIYVKGLCFINPLHYTISFGNAKNVTVSNTKTFSCHGWSDGFDMMSSQNIKINGCFLRTSDDCIAIYGSRWKNFGDSRHIEVKNSVLWADVAHPINIGTHGDYARDGDIIEDLYFENIDILEHHEFQPNYLGAIALNPGDKNTIRNATFKNIRIDPFEHGAVFDIQVKFNRTYNPAPGRSIENIIFEDIIVKTGNGEEISRIQGYDADHGVKGIYFKNYYRDGKKATNATEANFIIGDFTSDITIQ